MDEESIYRINISPRQMVIAASDKRGFTHAVQTLRQWVTGSTGILTFACADISDSPRTPWRCFLLDSGRQYQKISTIKKYIDMVSLLKMNYFHWHLTEGLGWRIEIKQYPRLAQIGGSVGKGEEQQGFYTQKEIQEIIEYAKKLQRMGARNVLVSRGKDGAILVAENGEIKSIGIIPGKPLNSVGCGDSMVAGFVAGYMDKKDYSYALKLGSACSNATAFSYTLADSKGIEDAFKKL